MKLKNVLIVGTALMFLLSGSMAFADNGKTDPNSGINPSGFFGKNGFDNGNAWWKGDNDIPTNGNCEGPECNAQGAGGISTFALTYDLSYDGKIVPNGAAGGIGGAAALAAGKASGEVQSGWIYTWVGPYPGNWGWKYTTLGSIDLNLHSEAGAGSVTDHYVWHPTGRNSIGVGSDTNNYAGSHNTLELKAFGLAEADGLFVGGAAQASLDGSIMTKSLHKPWNSDGVTMGLAGQGSAGAYIGGGITGLAGCVVVEGGMDMYGHSRSESYRIKDGDTEILGSNVQAHTTVLTYENVNDGGLAVGGVEGGFIAGGIAASKTIQAVNNGVASASALGVYAGGGELGCNFNGSAVGYTQTSARPIGTNGAIMTSSAGMKVSTFPQQQVPR